MTSCFQLRQVLRCARGAAPFALALVLVVLALLRARVVDAHYGAHLDCRGCMGIASVGQDSWMLAVGFGLLAVGVGARSTILRLLAMLAALLLGLAMAADLSILSLLAFRLYLFDVFKFGAEGAASLSFVAAVAQQYPVLWPCACLLGGALLVLCVWPASARPQQARSLWTAAALALLLALGLRSQAPVHVLGDAYLNLWQLHLAQGTARPYSAQFAQRLAQDRVTPPQHCEAGQGRQPNIVLVVWESLSTYHSGLGGTGASLVPEFDRVARAHTWFSAFHANGFSTDQGLIALLTGDYPIPQPGRYASLQAFAGYGDAEHSLPGQLQALGYWTGFFSTGDLAFLDKPSWLRALGFDHWEGAEHASYHGLPRGPFGAAADEALYRRFLDWRATAAAQPFLAVLLTVESHPPFVDRASGRLDEAAAFGAADAAFGRFQRELQDSGFFEDGILIVLGDHRSMTPLRGAERVRYGESALARVPMLVAGASGLPPGEIALPFQQTDLLPSLRQLAAERACHRPDQGRFLRPDPRPPSYILHVRGDQRSRIDLYAPEGNTALILAGDDSYWTGTRRPDAALIAEQIHADRIRRGTLPSDLPALLQLSGYR